MIENFTAFNDLKKLVDDLFNDRAAAWDERDKAIAERDEVQVKLDKALKMLEDQHYYADRAAMALEDVRGWINHGQDKSYVELKSSKLSK